MSRQIQGIIFDMDGLLFDTEQVYYNATKKVADAMGFPYDKEIFLTYLGVSDEDTERGYHQRYHHFGEAGVAEFIRRSYIESDWQLDQGYAQLKTGARELLAYLDQEGIPRVLASSNNRRTIDKLLQLASLDGFKGIVSAEDVERAKPDPEIFVRALEILTLPPTTALVLEDSLNGVRAAHQAGIPVIMVPDLLPANEEAQAKALVLADLTKVQKHLH